MVVKLDEVGAARPRDDMLVGRDVGIEPQLEDVVSETLEEHCQDGFGLQRVVPLVFDARRTTGRIRHATAVRPTVSVGETVRPTTARGRPSNSVRNDFRPIG